MLFIRLLLWFASTTFPVAENERKGCSRPALIWRGMNKAHTNSTFHLALSPNHDYSKLSLATCACLCGYLSVVCRKLFQNGRSQWETSFIELLVARGNVYARSLYASRMIRWQNTNRWYTCVVVCLFCFVAPHEWKIHIHRCMPKLSMETETDIVVGVRRILSVPLRDMVWASTGYILNFNDAFVLWICWLRILVHCGLANHHSLAWIEFINKVGCKRNS